MNEVLRQLAARKSVRVYTGEPVTAEEKQVILQAAFDAPTAGCQMLYTIIDVREQPRKDQLAELCDPPVSKSAFNHRLRKLVELSK